MLALKGRRIRAAVPLFRFSIYDPVIPRLQRTIDLAAGHQGLIANAIGDKILLDFATNPGPVLPSLDRLPQSGILFDVIEVNGRASRTQFLIEG